MYATLWEIKLRTLIQCARYSGVWLTFTVNPLHWRVTFLPLYDNEMSGRTEYNLQIGPLGLQICIDNGKW